MCTIIDLPPSYCSPSFIITVSQIASFNHPLSPSITFNCSVIHSAIFTFTITITRHCRLIITRTPPSYLSLSLSIAISSLTHYTICHVTFTIIILVTAISPSLTRHLHTLHYCNPSTSVAFFFISHINVFTVTITITRHHHFTITSYHSHSSSPLFTPTLITPLSTFTTTIPLAITPHYHFIIPHQHYPSPLVHPHDTPSPPPSPTLYWDTSTIPHHIFFLSASLSHVSPTP